MKLRIYLIKYLRKKGDTFSIVYLVTTLLFITYCYQLSSETLISILTYVLSFFYFLIGNLLLTGRKNTVYPLELIFLPLDITHVIFIHLSNYFFFIPFLFILNMIKSNKLVRYLFLEKYTCKVFELEDKSSKDLLTIHIFLTLAYAIFPTLFYNSEVQNSYLLIISCVNFVYLISFVLKIRILYPFVFMYYIISFQINTIKRVINSIKLLSRFKKPKLNFKIFNKINKPIEFQDKKNSILLNALEKKETSIKKRVSNNDK